MLSNAQSKGAKVQLTFKRVSSGGETMFMYTQRDLTIRDLRVVGPAN